MIFGRVKPLDAILAAAEGKSLHRTLGAFQLTLFGIGSVIGTGIFVLTAAGAQKAGPGLMLAFAIAGAICIVAALCYAEIAAMIPVAGSAYTYTYSTMGELLAWTVGWALVLEYAVAASAVSVGWSGYFTGTILNQFLGIQLPRLAVSAGRWRLGGVAGGFINLPAVVIALLVTWLLMIGTTESAKVNAILVGDQGGRADRVHRPDLRQDRHGDSSARSCPPAYSAASAPALARSARRRRSSSPMSASTRFRPRRRRPRTRSATCRSA